MFPVFFSSLEIKLSDLSSSIASFCFSQFYLLLFVLFGNVSVAQHQFEISASTSTNSENTGTGSIIQISFFVDGAWTQAETFFSEINSGQTKSKSFNTLSSPSKVKFIATTADAWGYWKILLDNEIVLIDPNGESGTDYGDNPYWLDGDETASAQQEYDLTFSSGDYNYTDPGDGNHTDSGDGNHADAGDGNYTDPGDENHADSGDGNHAEPGDGNLTDPGKGKPNGEFEGSDGEHNATIDLSEPITVLTLGDQEELADFAEEFGTIYFQYFDANVSGDFGPGDPWALSIEEGTGALESVVVDMGGLVFAGEFVSFWEQAYDLSPKDAKWNETDYNATAEGISSLYDDHPSLDDFNGEHWNHTDSGDGNLTGPGKGKPNGEFEGSDGEHNATIDLSEPITVLTLGDQVELADFASVFGSIWFQFYDEDESGDFGPGDLWTISIEDGKEDALEKVTVDMDGLVFAGDFEAYWLQVMDISIQDDGWHENRYEATFEGIVSLYEDYAFLQDSSVEVNEGKNEFVPGPAEGEEDEHGEFESDPAEGEDDEHQLAIVKTIDFDLWDVGLVRLTGSLLYGGDTPKTETGFVISDSLFLGDNDLEAGSAVDHEHGFEHEVRVIAIDRNNDGDFSFDFVPSLSGATYYYRAYAINEAGASYGAPKKFVSEHFDDSSRDEKFDDLGEEQGLEVNSPWTDATSLEGGWLDVPWFGAILTFEDNDWIFHDGLGWLFFMPDGEGGVWLWQEERGWLWTKSGLWPYLYQHDHAEWIYFLGNRQGRAFIYNSSTNEVEDHQ